MISVFLHIAHSHAYLVILDRKVANIFDTLKKNLYVPKKSFITITLC